ncbi:type II secretion system protein [Rubritalea profundi]|nr:type II secretion system protein [Rubritalea profundi]
MTPHTHSRPRGATLIELAVVISMLLSLISALFISAKYYKEAADKSSCITQISQFQKAVRTYQNLNSLANGDSISSSDFYGEDKPYRVKVFCPLGGGDYNLLEEIPSSGVAFATCAEYNALNGSKDPSQAHTSANLSGW